jgi:hypothetical protein
MPPYRIAPYPIQADHDDTITGTAQHRDLDCRFTSKPFKLIEFLTLAAPAPLRRHTHAIGAAPTRFWRFSHRNAIVLELLLKDRKAEIISERRAKTIVAVGKRLGLAGFVGAAAKTPRNQRVPDVHDMHSDALPAPIAPGPECGADDIVRASSPFATSDRLS